MSNRGNPPRGRGQPRGGSSDTAGRGRGQGSNAPPSSQGSFRGGAPFDRGQGGGGGGGPGGGPYGGGGGGRGAGGGGSRGGPGGSRGGRGGFGGPVIFKEDAPAQLPPRLATAGLQQLITGFKSLKVKPERPLRPGFGTIGTEITLRANFFPVKIPQGLVYDYVVDISPKTDINRLKIRIFELLERSPLFQPHLPYTAHDRSQRVVSSRKLPHPLDIPIRFYDDHETGPGPNAKVYTISVKFERELDPRQLTR